MHRHYGSLAELRLISLQCLQNQRAHVFRGWRVRTNLHDTGLGALLGREQRAKVQVLRQDDPVVLRCPIRNLLIQCGRFANITPVDSVVPRALEGGLPIGGQAAVDHYMHGMDDIPIPHVVLTALGANTLDKLSVSTQMDVTKHDNKLAENLTDTLYLAQNPGLWTRQDA